MEATNQRGLKMENLKNRLSLIEELKLLNNTKILHIDEFGAATIQTEKMMDAVIPQLEREFGKIICDRLDVKATFGRVYRVIAIK